MGDDGGRIPFVFRIGVTGHRSFDDPSSIGAAVGGVLARIEELVPHTVKTERVFAVVTPLAEGADRLVAHQILDRWPAKLEVALPLPVDDYVADFASEDSKTEFRELLGRASITWEAPPTRERAEAYERAGRYVVDRSDIVIAVWDGEPSQGRGGTADIVEYARSRRVPLLWVRTNGAGIVEEIERGAIPIAWETAESLDEFNEKVIPAERFNAHEAAQLRDWGIPAAEPSAALPLDAVAAWLLPSFVRADLLALRYQRWYKLLSAGIFVLASLAVLVVAIQATLFPEQHWIVGFEVVVLTGMLAIPWINRRTHLHEHWISFRFLAERLRSFFFLTLAGTGDRRERRASLTYASDPSELWIESALRAISLAKPVVPADPATVVPLRTYLADRWIGSQLRYHRKVEALHRGRDRRELVLTASLFGLTVVAAFLHMLGVGAHAEHGTHFGEWLIVFSLSIPAVGAAVHGIGVEREFRRHAERYARMVLLLEQLETRMRRAGSLEEVQRIAADTERVMREESSDWFGVMRFHDVELIT